MQAKEIVEEVENLLIGEFSNSDLDDCLSVCSDMSIDEIELTSKDDPIFMEENLKIWNQKPLHNYVSKYLNSRLSSLKNDTTIGEFRQNLLKMRADEETSLFKSKCERLRRFERVAKLREIEPTLNTKGILIVKDLHNIVFEYGPCKYGTRCFNSDCIFSHPPKPPQAPRQQWRAQNRHGRTLQFFGHVQADQRYNSQFAEKPQGHLLNQVDRNSQILAPVHADQRLQKRPSSRPQFLGRQEPQPRSSQDHRQQFLGQPQLPQQRASQDQRPRNLEQPRSDQDRKPQFLGQPRSDQDQRPRNLEQPRSDQDRKPQFLGRPGQGRRPQFLEQQKPPQLERDQGWQVAGRRPQFIPQPTVKSNFVIKCEINVSSSGPRKRMDARPQV